MSECADDTVRDLIPEYLLGTLDEARRADVAAHVERCRSCALEVSMLRAAHRVLDAAPPVDIARIVRALPAPPTAAPALTLVRGGALAPAPTPVAPRRRGTSWRVAATIATIAVSAVSVGVVQSLLRDNHPHAQTVVATPVVPTPVAPDPETAGVSAAGSLSDLSDSEMQTLLTDIDTLDAVPAAEPQPTVSGLHRVVGEQ